MKEPFGQGGLSTLYDLALQELFLLASATDARLGKDAHCLVF